MAERYVRMNILTSGADDAKATLDELTLRARRLEAESPDLKINADDTKAQAKIKDLQLKIQILNRQRAEVAFETKGDEAAKAKLLDISARLRKLDETVAKPSIKIADQERVEAQLIRIKLLMDDIHSKRVDITVNDRTSLLSRLFGRGGGGGGGSSAIGEIAGSGGGGVGSGLLSSVGGANNQYTGAAIGAIIAAAASIAPALIPLAIAGLVGGAGVVGAYKYSPTDKGLITGVLKGLEQDLVGGISSNAQRPNQGGPGRTGGTVPIPGTSFISGLGDILKQISGFVKSIGPELADMFRASVPFVSMFAKVMEQLAVLLLPAFTQSMKQLQPYIPQLIGGFKILSQGIADFLIDLGPGMKYAVTDFKGLMMFVKGVLIALAAVADLLAYAFARMGHNMSLTATFARGVWDAFRHSTATTFDGLRHDIATIWDDIWAHTVGTELKWTRDLFDMTASWRHGVASNFDLLRHDVAAIWDNMWDAIRQKLGSNVSAAINEIGAMERRVVSVFDSIKHSVTDLWDTLWFDVTTKTSGAVAELGRIWGKIEGLLSGPWNWLMNNVFHPIEHVWDDIAGVVGLPKIGGFAQGGRVPGPTDTVPALLTPGEVVVPVGMVRAGAVDHLRGMLPGFAMGGGVPGPANPHGAPTVTGNGGFNLFDFIGSLLGKAAEAALNTLLHINVGAGAGIFGNMGRMILSDIGKAIEHGITSLVGSSGGVGGNVSSFTPTILRVLAMLGQPASDLSTVLRQMTTESGGSLTAVNKSDINWQEGHPSVGLMQVIAGTFDAYAGPFKGIGPFAYGVSENALANIYAGINYAIHRYGPGWTSVLGHGHGYANGGLITEPIMGMGMHTGTRYSLGENGHEYVSPAGRFGPGAGDVYNIYPPDSATDPEKYALTMIQTIRRYKKHHGNQSTGIG